MTSRKTNVLTATALTLCVTCCGILISHAIGEVAIMDPVVGNLRRQLTTICEADDDLTFIAQLSAWLRSEFHCNAIQMHKGDREDLGHGYSVDLTQKGMTVSPPAGVRMPVERGLVVLSFEKEPVVRTVEVSIQKDDTVIVYNGVDAVIIDFSEAGWPG